MIGLVFFAVLAAPAAPVADVYFEQSTVVLQDGRPSGPGVVSRVWYAGRRMRLEPGNTVDGPALILRIDQGKAYRVDPAGKRAVVVDLDILGLNPLALIRALSAAPALATTPILAVSRFEATLPAAIAHGARVALRDHDVNWRAAIAALSAVP